MIARAVDSAEFAEGAEVLSSTFRALRERARELVSVAGEARLAGAPEHEVGAAERAACAAEEEAWRQLLADREAARRQERDERNAERERERLAEQEDATIGRIVLALRDRGPLTGGELEALRIEGASHNSLRPLLRRAVGQGLVTRQRDGRRVLWSAMPHGEAYSPEWTHPRESDE